VPAAVTVINQLAQGRLVFEPNSTTLGPEAGAALDEIAAVLLASPEVNVFVDGHTDNQGDADENLQLSELRANVVVAELTARAVARDRLTPRGFGGERPIADNGTEEGQAANRRIEFTNRP
jgi:outer membrane protein OmpA-like peptidoglycan-associated protein